MTTSTLYGGMNEPLARKRSDGSTVWYARVRDADGVWHMRRLDATDRRAATQQATRLQLAADRCRADALSLKGGD